MATVRPFRGLRFAEAAGPLESCLAPPYDVVSPERQRRLLAASPYNVLHVDLPPAREGEPPEAKYARAGETYRAWRARGILRREAGAALYLIETDVGGAVRRGILAAVGLVPFDAGIVLPHERTMAGPKADRLAIMEATRAALSPIFALYRDDDREVAAAIGPAFAGPPDVTVTDPDGVVHRMWVVDDRAITDAVSRAFENRRLYIADGHHRYETALAYRAAHPDLPAAGFVPMALTALDDPGLAVLPTHRVLRGVEPIPLAALAERVGPGIRATPVAGPLDRLLADLAEAGRLAPAVLVAGREAAGLAYLRLEWTDPGTRAAASPRERLDVTRLERDVLVAVFGASAESIARQANLVYVKDAAEAVGLVERGEAAHAFLLNGTPPAEVVAVAEAGETMPQKSTYFAPKLPTGLVILPLD
ncbi:MAG TPA: DUF1015 domain-containing protein [Thermodesulfobacteriota bacterium]